MSMIIEMLRLHEGVETHAYKCTANKTTIGVGRNIDPDGGIGLIDICFNMGLPRLLKFEKSLTAMSIGDYDRAADEFLDSRWANQVGARAITITDMIRTGDY